MSGKAVNRRQFLRTLGVIVTGAAGAHLLGACQPKVVEVEKIVKETVEVEKIVKEAIEVEKEVTRVVEKQVPTDTRVLLRYHCRAGNRRAPNSEYPIHQNRLQEFLEENPGIDVEIVEIAEANLSEYYVKLATMVAGGTVGDMTWTHQSDLDHQRLAYQGVLAPTDEFMAADGVDEGEWYPGAIAGCKLGDHIYSLPFSVHPGVQAYLYFNKNMFEEAGLELPDGDAYTIDQLADAAEKLSQGSADNRDVYGFYPQFAYSSQSAEGWMRTWGAYSFINEEGTKSLMNTPEALEWAKYGNDLYNVRKCAVRQEALPTGSSGAELTLFGAQKLASWQSGWWRKAAAVEVAADQFEVGIVQFPIGPAGRGTGAYMDGFAVTSASEHKAEAWKLVRAYTDRRCAYLGLKLAGTPPARGDVYEEPDIKEDPWLMLDYKANSESMPQFTMQNFRGTEHGTMLRNLMNRIWLGEEEPTQAYMDEVARQLQEIIDKPA